MALATIFTSLMTLAQRNDQAHAAQAEFRIAYNTEGQLCISKEGEELPTKKKVSDHELDQLLDLADDLIAKGFHVYVLIGTPSASEEGGAEDVKVIVKNAPTHA